MSSENDLTVAPCARCGFFFMRRDDPDRGLCRTCRAAVALEKKKKGHARKRGDFKNVRER